MSRTIAMVAQPGRRAELVELALDLHDQLSECRIVASEATGGVLRDRVGLDVDPVVATPVGGDAQITALVAAGEVDLVILLRDSFASPTRDPGPKMLQRICEIRGVPVATNTNAVRLCIEGLSRIPARASHDELVPAAWLA